MKIIDHEAKSFRYAPRRGVSLMKWIAIAGLAIADVLGILITLDSSWASTHNQALFNGFIAFIVFGVVLLAFVIIPNIHLNKRFRKWSQRFHGIKPTKSIFKKSSLMLRQGVKETSFHTYKDESGSVNWHKVTKDYGNTAQNTNGKNNIVIVKLDDQPFSKDEASNIIAEELSR